MAQSEPRRTETRGGLRGPGQAEGTNRGAVSHGAVGIPVS